MLNDIYRRILFVMLAGLLVTDVQAQTANGSPTVGTVSGNYSFSYNQTPDQLVDIYPVQGTVISVQWEQSSYPATGFTSIPGATNAGYIFSSPLSQTAYFRKYVLYSVGGVNQSVYSNTVKMNVVSVNWEDYNYVREHHVLIPGQTNWQAIDQLAVGDKLQTTTYLDGLGRPIQKVSRETATPGQGGTLWGDVVQFSVFDKYGRDSLKFLPYTTATQSGKFKTNPLADQTTYYSNVYNETAAYSKVTYDNSPLNRAVKVNEPGSVWAASAGKSAAYDVNTVSDGVVLFGADYVQGDAPIYRGLYPAGVLYKLTYVDENNHQVVEFKDKSGRLILKKVQVDDIPSAAHAGWSCTYSVYDDFGLLRFQLQPEGVKWLDANGWNFAAANGSTILAEQCFQYGYDDKGRMVWKKAPGAQPLNMVFDQRDRVVFMQDGNQAAMSTPQWTTNLYDDLDRLTVTTLYQTTQSISALQTNINNATATSTVTITNAGSPVTDLVLSSRDPSQPAAYTAQNSIVFSDGFSSADNDNFTASIDPAATSPAITTTTTVYNNPINQSDLNNPAVTTIVKYLFYDNYSFAGARPFSSNFNNTAAYSGGNTMPISPTARTLSMPTGSSVRVLGTNTFLTATQYYDEDGRHIQSIENNIKQGWDITTLQYAWDGRMLSSYTSHTTQGTGYTNFGVLTKNIFDKIGRVVSLQKQYGSNSWVTIANYDYDDMGRLKTKHLAPGYQNPTTGNSELESLTYSYNIHNNITGVNKDYAVKNSANYNKWGNYFGLYLGFDNKDGQFAKPNLNGQVTGLLWNTQGDAEQRKYDYTYDNAGRLVTADFNQNFGASGWSKSSPAGSSASLDFSSSMSYDLNGNLQTMQQKGVLAGQGIVTVDDLQYRYAQYSNKLLAVTDNSPLAASGLNGTLGDFKDGSNGSADDYVYDNNGNLVIDLNKNISSTTGGAGITYNYLDKPETIHINGKGMVRITYDADGNKIARSFTPENNSTATVTTYINQFVYTETTNSGSLPPMGGGGTLSYINFEEGRLRVMQPASQAVTDNNGIVLDAVSVAGNLNLPVAGSAGTFDYFIRDYQQNVRMVLTQETHSSSSTCTMESARTTVEDAVFEAQPGGPVEQSQFAVASIPGQPWGTGQDVIHGVNASKLSKLTGITIGPNSLLKVMAGDEVSANTQYYYQNNTTNNSNNSLVTDMLASLTQALMGSPVTSGTVAHGQASNIINGLNSNLPPLSSVADPNQYSGDITPRAYLNVLFFDERFNFVSENSSFVRVSSIGNANASLNLLSIKAPKNGYAYVYVSNESDEPVYFDNFKVALNRGRLIEENHYYAYGLRIAGLSSRKLGSSLEGSLKNNYQYNDKELLDDGDLNWYDYGFRNYDAQIGRFVQIDPLADETAALSTYHYALNDPIGNIDEDGLSGVGVLGQVACWSGQSASFMNVLNTLKSIGSVASVGVRILNITGNLTRITETIINGGTVINGDQITQGVGNKGGEKLPDDFVKFTQTAYDLDGGRKAYTDDDEGTDYLRNGKPSFIKGKDGGYIKQKNNISYILSQTAKFKNPSIPEKHYDPDRYYDPEVDAYIANNPALKKFGVTTGSTVSIKNLANGKIINAVVADNGPGKKYYIEGTLEMSPEAFRQLGINYEMSIPVDKKGKPLNNYHSKDTNGKPLPYQNKKYINAPSAELEVRKIKKQK